MLASPQDIPAQQVYTGEAANELALFGTNTADQPGPYFDPTQGIASTAQRG
ncbi:MAG TPA: hypothetical protein VKP04_00800 [Ktedonobacteraceae bacterium]|nr:hypothetical protein [Ktedonobacteraceae bacterium]